MARRKQPAPIARELGQVDLVAQIAPHCPTCGRPWKAAIRVCRKCGQAIGRGHKWRMVPVAPNLFGIEHRACDNPTAYRAAP